MNSMKIVGYEAGRGEEGRERGGEREGGEGGREEREGRRL